jgi:hypothetical protein
MSRHQVCLVVVLILTICCSGCDTGLASPTPTLFLLPTVAPTDVGLGSPTPISPVPQFELTPTQSVATPAGPCDHLLWPLVDGASWDYHVTSMDGAQSEVRLESKNLGDGIDLTLGSDTSHLNCIDGAVIGVPPGILGSGYPTLGGAVSATNPRGSLLASEDTILSMGVPWDLEADPTGSILLPIPEPTALPITGGRYVIFSTPGPQETVGVPAGTFVTLPIHRDIYYEITVQMPDLIEKKVLINVATQEYYAERVGLVKVMFEGGAISTEDGSITANLDPGASLELEQFKLP